RQIINELFERTKDQYYRLAEKNVDEATKFVGDLGRLLKPVIEKIK
ncbi:12623_t:CDS:1, partial [Gigaspora rosea]